MEHSTQTRLKFHGVSIVMVDLKVFNRFEGEHNIDLKIDAKLAPIEEGSQEFRIWMQIDMVVPDFWELKVGGFGNFELENAEAEENVRNFININAPAIMFPYMRSFIATLTTNCGGSIPIITLPPQFFQGEIEALKA